MTMTDEERLVDPIENPDLANQLGVQAMTGSDPDKPLTIDDPPVGFVTLAGGYLDRHGHVMRDAHVREMNGADEEELARPRIARNFATFMDTLINRCVETVGGKAANKEVLDTLLIGDRDLLLQEIRIATYGEKMQLDLRCPFCQHEFIIRYSFRELPIKQLDDMEITLRDDTVIKLNAEQRVYPIPLRNGRTALVELINGGIQRTVYTDAAQERTAAENNTHLLQLCVQAIDMQPVMPADTRMMGMADRMQILKFLVDAQPGPDWGGVKQTCTKCSEEFPLVIDAEIMFRSV